LSKQHKLHVSEADQGTRLDKYLSEKIDNLSRAKGLKLIQNSSVLINDKIVNPSYRVSFGEIVHILIPEAAPSHLVPWQLELEVIYEDNWILVINKPAGIAMHPAPGHRDKTQ
jgi:23S rRNA pseudouridine1911/1915/1917 synthase